jgi:hypothetical protein
LRGGDSGVDELVKGAVVLSTGDSECAWSGDVVGEVVVHERESRREDAPVRLVEEHSS